MSDRELLVLAAKAAGVKIDYSKTNGGGHGNTGFDLTGNAVLDWHNGETWNPLVDDGDALRLAAKLGLDTLHDDRSVTVKKFDNFNQKVVCEATEYGDRSTAEPTRRAIVRAAAELGRAT
ncbi:MAG: hypothetical protein WBX27_01165 [Specibacter sp.]